MAAFELADLFNVGAKLQAVNQDIKTALAEVGRVPVGTVPLDVAQALNALQQKFNQARELYTTVYRAVYGEVPTGLGAVALLGVPLVAWGQLVLLLAAGGIIWQLQKALRDAIQAWRERQATGLVQSKLQVVQENLSKAQAAGDAAAVAFYQKQLADLVAQSGGPGGDWSAWLQENLLLVAAGTLVVVLLMRR